MKKYALLLCRWGRAIRWLYRCFSVDAPACAEAERYLKIRCFQENGTPINHMGMAWYSTRRIARVGRYYAGIPVFKNKLFTLP